MVLAMILGGVACGGGSGSDNNPPAPNAITIMVKSTPTLEFKPRVDTVAQAGTVTWSWEAGSQDHNVISTGSPSFTSNGTATLPGTQDVDWFDAPHQYQLAFNSTTKYATLTGVLAADVLQLDSSRTTCNQYLGVELNALGSANTNCGGRTLSMDVVDVTYSAVAVGATTGVSDGIAQTTAPSATFPFFTAPQ